MSYDIRIAVKVPVCDECDWDGFAEVGHPVYAHPTYNIGDVVRRATGWDFKQGKFYKVTEILPMVAKGISELVLHPKDYEQYLKGGGTWGTVSTAVHTLNSIMEFVEANQEEWRLVPVEYLWIAW